MDTIIRKAYYHYENEEKWLNAMSARGLALVSYTWCRYVFVTCEPGEYIYRIELLDELPSHDKSKAYISFVEETGVESISSHMRWVYFRKKAADGPFDIYSDIDSRISHYKRIVRMWGIIGLINLLVVAVNLPIGLTRLLSGFSKAYVVLVGLNLVSGCLLTGLSISYFLKIKKLKKEKLLRE